MPRLLPLAVLLLLLPACSALDLTSERPQSLEPLPVSAAPGSAYDAVLTLAFDQGWRIGYANPDARLIELDRIDRVFLVSHRVRRLDALIRERDGQTYVHVRYHSFPDDDPADIDVKDEDRAIAERFARDLRQRLRARAIR